MSLKPAQPVLAHSGSPDLFAAHLEPILNAVNGRVSPTLEERDYEKRLATALLSKIKARVDKRAKLVFVGSAARDTGLRGSLDLDLFVAYPRTFSRDAIVSKTVKAVKTAVRAGWVMHYAEHPYLKTTLMATGPGG
ncbi:MAG: nucleotidyltransferase domain-containing protein, partial [Phycisphaerales bacterium]|nr:nucleotidyltransferase domain-containing protein [Phycisphaerales bacterium]